MATTRDITNTNWTLSVDVPGDIVQGTADIDQCIKIVLSTRKGSDRGRPDFGSDHFKYLDKPVNASGPGVLSEIQIALGLWEPRIKVTSVQAVVNDASVTFIISYSVIGTVITGQTDVTYGFAGR